MTNRIKNILLVFLFICIIVIAVLFRAYFLENPPRDNIINPQPTENSTTYIPVIVTPNVNVINTPQPTVIPTATPEVWYFTTVTPNNIINVTQAPTVLPTDVIIVIPTVTPTNVPTATPIPTVIPTSVPTATPIPTVTPTSAPTATSIPTATPTSAPTVTPIPTVIPTSVPTATPIVYSEEALRIVTNELKKITGGINEILPSYDSNRKYDLYKYISITNVEPNKLFDLLKSIYIDTLAHSLDFEFEYGSTPDGVKKTLETAYCKSCGKLKCIYKNANTAEMANLLERINFGNIQETNAILINFLYENTIVEDNISERLIVCCSCGK